MHAVIDNATATEYVVMTREEASAIADGLHELLTATARGEEPTLVLRELQALQTFLAAHCEAHGLT